jgi:hypothetical protein
MRWWFAAGAVVVALCDFEEGQAAAQPEAPSVRGQLSYTMTAGYVFGWTDNPDEFRIKESCCSGVAATANVGMRIDENRTVGLRLGLGWLDGYYRVDFADAHYGVRMIPIDLVVALQITEYQRYWATLFSGLHVSYKTKPTTESTHDDDPSVWDKGLAVGLQLGADVIDIGTHHIGLQAAFNGALGAANGYGSVSVGLSYRH